LAKNAFIVPFLEQSPSNGALQAVFQGVLGFLGRQTCLSSSLFYRVFSYFSARASLARG
jgi:hypothetical protein